jgi:hypothetical protein
VASNSKVRPLSYRRAVWFAASSHGKDLQTLLKEALDAFPNIEDTRIARGDQILEVRHKIKEATAFSSGSVTLIHVAAYTPKDFASLVPMKLGPEDADLTAMPPPEGHEFLDGDVMALLSGNDVCICVSGATEGALYIYLIKLFEKLGFTTQDLRFEIQKVANRSALKELVSEGVREITFDFATYELSIESLMSKKGPSLMGSIGAFFGADSGVDDLLGREGVQGFLTLKADGRVAHGAAQRALAGFASQVVDEEADGFVIETKTGDRITPSELSIRRYVPVEKDAKTIKHADAWSKLISFYEFVVDQNLNEF